MHVLVQRLDQRAKLPVRHNRDDAGADLCAIEEGVIVHGERALVRTGLAFAIPSGYYARIAPRSGLAAKDGIDVLAGVVDSGFCGEVKVVLINHGALPFKWEAGAKVAQLIIERCEPAVFWEGGPLGATDRGAGGFGSTDTDL